MGPLPTYRVGMNNFWRRVQVVAAAPTSANLVVPPASTMATGGTNRVVITEITISGRNTNAAATTITISNATTTTAIAFYAEMAPTTGSISFSQSGLWIPMVDGETVRVLVGGAITGFVDVTVGGIFLPGTTTAADKYTGIP